MLSACTMPKYNETTNNGVVSASDQYVYICIGPTAEVYHNSANCWGLGSCNEELKKITLYKALKMNRRPCKICSVEDIKINERQRKSFSKRITR